MDKEKDKEKKQEKPEQEKKPEQPSLLEKIQPRNIEDEMRTSYIDYAMSVIVGRALPDVRDGFKPVHRRILFTMKEMGLRHNTAYKKSARVVGDCLGKYHPHGDTAVYDSMVRMAQEFSLRYTLVEGQGNFGCFTGDTKIKLLDGTEKSFERLAAAYKPGEKFAVYSVNKSGDIVVGWAHSPRITKKNAEVIELTLDTGAKIRCTPDHRFLLRNGTYRCAKDINKNDSLMPGYFRTALIKKELNEYLQILQPKTNTWEFVHRLSDKENERSGVTRRFPGPFIRHHKNFNRFDNRPDNIERLGFKEHIKIHMAQIKELWKNDLFRARQSEGVKHYYKEHPEVLERRRKLAVERNHSEEFKKQSAQKRSKILKEKFAQNPELSKHISEQKSILWKDPAYREKMSKVLKGSHIIPLAPEMQERVNKIISEKSKQMWNSEKRNEIIANMRKAFKNPEVRKKISNNTKKLWLNPDYREKFTAEHFKKMATTLWNNLETKQLHSDKAKRQWLDIEFRNNFINGVHKANLRRIEEQPDYMHNLAQKSALSLSKKWKNPEYQNKVIRSRILKYGRSLLEKFKPEEITPDIYAKQRTNNSIPRFLNMLKYFPNLNNMLESARTYNHKVVSIKALNKKYDVWDITVNEYHNFLLADGVFVHNSLDGDSPAAMRYTEVRLNKISDEMIADLDKDTVDFGPNYDGSLTEPLVLPAKLPNLLVNGSSGIAVGMATNIPCHNLTEVIDGTIAYIENPEIQTSELNKIIKGPDFPTAGIICGRQGIKDYFETGRGSFIIRAKAEIEDIKSGKQAIIVREIPYQVNKATLLETIAGLVRDKKIEDISDLRDESDRDGVRVVIEIKRDGNANIVLNQLFKHTQMETSFGVIMLALVGGQPKVLSMKRMISCYLDHRREIVTRRTKFELRKAEERAHIVEGLRIAIDNLNKIIKTIRDSKDTDTARDNLMSEFKLSKIQAQAILDMKLHQLTGLERKKLEEEYLELIKTIERLKSILADPKKVLGIIRQELAEIREKYGDERRTKIQGAAAEMEIEDLIQEEDVVVTFSHAGYVKRMPVSTYKAQRRGGKGVMGMTTREEDFVEDLFVTNTHAFMLFFTNKGKAFSIRVFEIPEGSRVSKGKAIVNLVQLGSEEKITAAISIKSFEQTEGQYLFMCTAQGIVKKTDIADFSDIRKSGIIAVKLDPGDKLIDVKLVDDKNEIINATRHGMAIRFKSTDVRPMGRGAHGVRGIKLAKDDEVVSMEAVSSKDTIFTATENGYGKRTDLSKYRLTHRGGKGVKNMKTNERNGLIVGLKKERPGDEIMLITSHGQTIRLGVDDILIKGRNIQGVRLVRLEEGDKLASIAHLVKEESSNGNGNGNGENGGAIETPETK